MSCGSLVPSINPKQGDNSVLHRETRGTWEGKLALWQTEYGAVSFPEYNILRRQDKLVTPYSLTPRQKRENREAVFLMPFSPFRRPSWSIKFLAWPVYFFCRIWVRIQAWQIRIWRKQINMADVVFNLSCQSFWARVKMEKHIIVDKSNCFAVDIARK